MHAGSIRELLKWMIEYPPLEVYASTCRALSRIDCAARVAYLELMPKFYTRKECSERRNTWYYSVIQDLPCGKLKLFCNYGHAEFTPIHWIRIPRTRSGNLYSLKFTKGRLATGWPDVKLTAVRVVERANKHRIEHLQQWRAKLHAPYPRRNHHRKKVGTPPSLVVASFL